VLFGKIASVYFFCFKKYIYISALENIRWSRNVFSERWKTAIDVDCRICSGSEFQT